MFGKTIEMSKRPQSTGDVTDQNVWQVDEGILLRPRAATYSGSPSSFFSFTSTATCYNCLYDESNGREFCEIMGSSYCKQCIKTTRQKEVDEEVASALDVSSGNGYRTLLGENFFAIRQRQRQSHTSAFPSDRRLFIRLHNLNSNSAEYYINPTNGIETAKISVYESGSSLGESDRNLQLTNQDTPSFLQVPGQEATQRSMSKKKRKYGGTGKIKRKYVTFNGLPIEPPLITVDLSNQIMNHLVIKDS